MRKHREAAPGSLGDEGLVVPYRKKQNHVLPDSIQADGVYPYSPKLLPIDPNRRVIHRSAFVTFCQKWYNMFIRN